jgi:hypothetical protein
MLYDRHTTNWANSVSSAALCNVKFSFALLGWYAACIDVAGLHPQSPRQFAWQPLVQVSQTLRVSNLSHMTAATTQADKPWHLHRSYCTHTDLRALPGVGDQPRLADVICAWSWRLCGINAAIAVYDTSGGPIGSIFKGEQSKKNGGQPLLYTGWCQPWQVLGEVKQPIRFLERELVTRTW